MREGRKYGEGCLYQLPSGKWAFQRSWKGEGSRGRPASRLRRSVTADTPEEAERLGALLTKPTHNPKRRQRPNWKWVELHRADQVTARQRKARSLEYVAGLLATARSESWDDATIARVILAQLTAARVRRGIYGPCAYCGSWEATQVDHVIPTVRGGPDTADNIVSACQSCNYSKGEKLLSEWRSGAHMAATVTADEAA